MQPKRFVLSYAPPMKRFAAAFIMSILATFGAPAVILLNSGDASTNTSAPTGDLAGSGWQYEGLWIGFLGTAIAPHFFVTAQHFGIPGAGAVFRLQDVDYHTVASFAESGERSRHLSSE